MKTFETLTEAINDLKARGYDLDFNLKEDCIECLHSRTQLSANEFEITETYHFDGSTDVDEVRPTRVPAFARSNLSANSSIG